MVPLFNNGVNANVFHHLNNQKKAVYLVLNEAEIPNLTHEIGGWRSSSESRSFAGVFKMKLIRRGENSVPKQCRTDPVQRDGN